MLCARCGHENPPNARFCSSCGAQLVSAEGEETTLTLAAVEAADTEDELERYLDDLPAGVGLLVVRHGPETGSSYRLEQAKTAIGRHPDSDVFLDDITVSRRHVVIERAGDAFTLRDVGSLNGTYVNRKRVDEAKLKYGDEVQIGRYRLTFVVGGERGEREG
ncbi:MAG TPA: FHA domain-containing protein [Acidimicrobiia bacterium]|nr:FHA domain-containing protein [Acidimicrobiia bacterium]